MILNSLSVIFSFHPISLPPLPADSPEGVWFRKVCLPKKLRKIAFLTFSCVRISLSSWSASRRRPRCSNSSCFCFAPMPSLISHSWVDQNLVFNNSSLVLTCEPKLLQKEVSFKQPQSNFVSSDRSSYSDSGLLYNNNVRKATFWDFEHFCQYI